jgi:hypothetical protein
MTAYYNEFNPAAAEWLRNLIAEGLIAPGVVDERSIADVTPGDLAGLDQVHWFAGIGGWSLALRLAGVPDSRPVWTGSAPCQPFSSAGAGGGFDDERHLWPALFHHVSVRRPAEIFGEQVASKPVDLWIDALQADLESVGYAVGAVAFPSAGCGAPHIRDRCYWAGRLGNADVTRLEGFGSGHSTPLGQWQGSTGPAATPGEPVWLADADREGGQGGSALLESGDGEHGGPTGCGRSGPVAGFWRDADWLSCRDGKWRPVEPIPQQMVDGLPKSLGRLRSEQTHAFAKEVMEYAEACEIDAREALHNVWMSLAEETLRRTSGGLSGVHEAPVLLAFLRQLAYEGWDVAQGLPSPSPQTPEGGLRVLWEREAAARASHQRGLVGQSSGKHADAVRVLSSVLARHTQACWGEAFDRHASDAVPLIGDARSRVIRLHGYGNAINPYAAAAFLKAFYGVN